VKKMQVRKGHDMSNLNFYENEVLVSYAWTDESERMVDELEQAFAEYGMRIVRDKKEIGYKGSLEAFEQRIGRGQCVILVISDKYLRSEHCMYELVEVDKNRHLSDRIFPIVLTEAKIYDAIDRLDYIKYWEDKIEKLNQALRDIKVMTHLTGITSDLNKYANIRSSIDHLTDLLSDMNTLTPERHQANGFSTLIDAVKLAMGKTVSVSSYEIIKENDESINTAQQPLKSYYRDLLVIKEYLPEFERKLSQSASNLGILIAAQDKFDDLGKIIALIMQEIENMGEAAPYSLSDLVRISELTDMIYNLIESASGMVAIGGNPNQQLNQISQNLSLFRKLIGQLSLSLGKIDSFDS